MPKNADEKIALVALFAFAAWVFVGLPLLYLPSQHHVHGEILGVKYGEWLLFLATVALAVTSWLLVKGGEKTAERQLRAYVLVDKATVFSATREGVVAFYPADAGKGGRQMEVQAGYQPMARFDFKNFGQTPARDVEMFGNVAIVPWPLRPETLPEIDWDQEHSRQIIGPGGVREKYEMFAQPHLVGVEEYNGLRSGTLALVFFGEVRYLDAFGKNRISRYRFFTGGGMGLRGISLAEHDDGNSYT